MRALRSLLPILFLALVYTSCTPEETSSSDPYHAVPSNANLIIEINDYKDALDDFSNTRFAALCDSVAPLLRWKSSLSDLKNTLESEQLEQFLDDRKLLLSMALSGADKFDLLLITSAESGFEQFLGQRLSEHYEVAKRDYSGTLVYHFHQPQSEKEYFVCSYQGLLLFSQSQTLIEEAVRQMDTEFSIKDEPAFQKLYRTANRKDPANLYLNFAESSPMLKQLIPGGDLSFLPRIGEWMEMDLQIFEKELLMSGISVMGSEGESYLSAFGNSDAGVSRGKKIVPDGFGLWLALNFENAEQYYRSYEDYLEQSGRLRKHQQLLDKLEKDGQKHFLEWVDDEIGLIILPGKGESHIRLAYLKIRDEDGAQERLDSVSDASFIEGYRGVIIKKLNIENALPRVYGNVYSQFHYPFYFIHENYAVFSPNLAGIKGLVNDILDEKTLENSPSFRSFNSHLPDRSNVKIVLGNPAGLHLLANLIDEKLVKEFNGYKSHLESFQYLALQMNVDDEVAFSNLYLQSAQKEDEKVSRVWSTGLKAKVSGEPQFLMNHNSRKYDIAVQDEDHRLYLLDRKGNILWTRELDGPIMGMIRQVDAFRNRKLQMVFNTRNKLYMMDRLGRDVENFPINLSAECTAPVAVLDYDNTRKYRFLIPQGKVLSNLNIDGKRVQGWAFEEAPANIVRMPQHFAVSGKDIIVAQCADGSLLQINRRGQQRFKSITGLPVFQDDFYLVKGDKLSDSELIAVGDDGMLYSVKPGGSMDKVYLDQDYPADDLFYFEGRYIFSSGRSLIVKDEEKPWQADFESDISQAPKAMILKGKFYAAAYSSGAEEIRLYNSDGLLISGFPVFAQGTFDMGSLNLDGSINIVTSSNDGTLICYRVN
jgi:hypothetical protein